VNGGRRISVRGTVQGVGFRPWVYRVARAAGLGGTVRNDPRGVIIEAFGGDQELDEFVEILRSEAPQPALVRELEQVPIDGARAGEFSIVASGADGHRDLSIPADLATCPDCEVEIFAPANRRFRYPFTNCTHCGPRFTIATGVPYDRAATTMAGFTMCPACRSEYESVLDRRFHAQPNACPVCGPRLTLLASDGSSIPVEDPLLAAAARLAAGEIVAVKGLGGFHLACDAVDNGAVARLRQRKHRYAKPFAVMVRDLEVARRVALLSPEEEALLASPERPIVLCTRRGDEGMSSGPSSRPWPRMAPGLSAEIAPDTDRIGLMLPYTPLHHLLLAAVSRPLVMTSANRADEPICTDNVEAVDRLADIADALLVHDRPIAIRCDDSVGMVIAGKPTLIRRSRGYVPRPIALTGGVAQPVLACGAHLKNTFCLATGDLAYFGPHIGDLDELEALRSYEDAIARMERILDLEPTVVAHDLHPQYQSTRYALARRAATPVAVQHHHAHVASAMAEHGLLGPVIGVAFDGTGLGTDGTAWGGEILMATLDGFERLATFRPLPLAGGDAAIREVWRIGLAMLDDAFDGKPPDAAVARLLERVSESDVRVVRQMIAGGINAPLAHGVGRYFDGAGALGLGWTRSAYEGQVAVAWDRVADPQDCGCFPYELARTATPMEIDLRPMVRNLTYQLLSGVAPAILSARFHAGLINATSEAVRAALVRVGPLPVVLTGGSFQNRRLAEGVMAALDGRTPVYAHREVPPGDGGLALGQALVADARVRRGQT